jgi:magnesium transporter
METMTTEGVEAPRRDMAEPEEKQTSAVRILLFDAEHGDQEITTIDGKLAESLRENQLLWIDMQDPSGDEIRELAGILSLPDEAVEGYLGTETNPTLENCGKCFWLRVVSVNDAPGNSFPGAVLTIVAGQNLVVSLHKHPAAFLEFVRENKSTKGRIGDLGAGSFVSALLDWQLGTYFEAVSRFEIGVERLEVDVLSENPRDCIAELRSLRKGASRLRRMLAPHRVVFSALARPDFRPEEDDRTQRHFETLDTHFERAMDMVENARDLVVGSFELFSSQTALVANKTMKVLTFVTVVAGMLAVISGVLGMNFQAPFFKAGTVGFVVAVGLMLSLGVGSVLLGRWRRWF